MEYICYKIIHVTYFENLNIYFKTRVVDGILGLHIIIEKIQLRNLNLKVNILGHRE
jgi:hypothetical protein